MLGKVARVRHIVAGAGQHVVGRMVEGSAGPWRATREKERIFQVPAGADGVGRPTRARPVATTAFISEGAGRGRASPANKRVGLSVAREEVGRGATHQGLLSSAGGCPHP